MDVQEFQKKLGELCRMAESQNKTVTAQQVREFFAFWDCCIQYMD